MTNTQVNCLSGTVRFCSLKKRNECGALYNSWKTLNIIILILKQNKPEEIGAYLKTLFCPFYQDSCPNFGHVSKHK